MKPLHLKNEPSYGENYPSCIWTPALFTKFVGQYLGPAFDTAAVSAKIMLGTMSKNSSGDDLIVTAVMADAAAKKYIKLLGYQWTMKANVAAAKSYNLPIWQTEHQCGNYPWASGYVSTAAPNDQAYGVESWGLIRDWIKAGATAYSAWNMVLDTVGQSIDTTTNWKQNALLSDQHLVEDAGTNARRTTSSVTSHNLSIRVPKWLPPRAAMRLHSRTRTAQS